MSKDVCTVDGIKIKNIKETKKSKRNYLCQYLIIKNVFRELNMDYQFILRNLFKYIRVHELDRTGDTMPIYMYVLSYRI